MKKFISVFLIILMIFSLSACDTPIIETTQEPQLDIIVVDNDVMKMTVTGFEEDRAWGLWTLKALIENKTEETLMFSWEDVAVNGYMIDPFWATEISGGKKENCKISFFLTLFDESGISNVEEIEFDMWVYHIDEESYEITNYMDEMFTITLS